MLFIFMKSTLTPPKDAEKCPSTLDPPEYGTSKSNQISHYPYFCLGVLTHRNLVFITYFRNRGHVLR